MRSQVCGFKRGVAGSRRPALKELSCVPFQVEAEFDAIKAGVEPDYSAWIAKVEEIKARYPLPEAG
ncbi:hypothetical protein IPC884_25585 [Pseudomonas aeruginosa]|nr:hypothetical protein IPC884_25585 [Pseudomonas aeruginosa]WCW93032.1 hypothetical protein KK205_04445 [Pseudomonas aeruginosa]